MKQQGLAMVRLEHARTHLLEHIIVGQRDPRVLVPGFGYTKRQMEL